MRLTSDVYEPRLKEALVCFRCGETAKNMPALKKHLQEEFDMLRKRQLGKLKRKRETEPASRNPDIGKVARAAAAAQAKGGEGDIDKI